MRVLGPASLSSSSAAPPRAAARLAGAALPSEAAAAAAPPRQPAFAVDARDAGRRSPAAADALARLGFRACIGGSRRSPRASCLRQQKTGAFSIIQISLIQRRTLCISTSRAPDSIMLMHHHLEAEYYREGQPNALCVTSRSRAGNGALQSCPLTPMLHEHMAPARCLKSLKEHTRHLLYPAALWKLTMSGTGSRARFQSGGGASGSRGSSSSGDGRPEPPSLAPGESSSSLFMNSTSSAGRAITVFATEGDCAASACLWSTERLYVGVAAGLTLCSTAAACCVERNCARKHPQSKHTCCPHSFKPEPSHRHHHQQQLQRHPMPPPSPPHCLAQRMTAAGQAATPLRH